MSLMRPPEGTVAEPGQTITAPAGAQVPAAVTGPTTAVSPGRVPGRRWEFLYFALRNKKLMLGLSDRGGVRAAGHLWPVHRSLRAR